MKTGIKFYTYEWLKPIIKWFAPYICKWRGHKIKAQYLVHQTDRKKWRGRDRQHKEGGTLEVRERFNPYMIYYCDRCRKKLKTVRLERMLTEKEALDYSNKVLAQMKKLRGN